MCGAGTDGEQAEVTTEAPFRVNQESISDGGSGQPPKKLPPDTSDKLLQ